jgi:hypothetical protein
MENVTNEVVSNTTLDARIDSIEKNVSAITEADLFLVAFIVVIVVCFLLYKAVDKFISF